MFGPVRPKITANGRWPRMLNSEPRKHLSNPYLPCCKIARKAVASLKPKIKQPLSASGTTAYTKCICLLLTSVVEKVKRMRQARDLTTRIKLTIRLDPSGLILSTAMQFRNAHTLRRITLLMCGNSQSCVLRCSARNTTSEQLFTKRRLTTALTLQTKQFVKFSFG